MEPGVYTLSTKFNLYTNNEPEFRQKLSAIMIENLNELRDSVHNTLLANRDTVGFGKIVHKVKTVLVILDDKELIGLVDYLSTYMDKPDTECDLRLLTRFDQLLNEIIFCLKEESGQQKSD